MGQPILRARKGNWKMGGGLNPSGDRTLGREHNTLRDDPMSERKKAVRDFWDTSPCGTSGLQRGKELRRFFESIEKRRYELEPFILDHAEFDKWRGKKILEVGCGTGTDLLQFLRAEVNAFGVDLSIHSVDLARKRLGLFGLNGRRVFVGDAEHLPFPENSFDLVYSWGVLHHTPDIARAIDEICRVLRPGGEARIMVYHRWSLVALRSYVRFGLLRGRPMRSLDDIMAVHQESPGTKVYTQAQVRQLLRRFQNIEVRAVLTPYDLSLADGRLSFTWLRRFVPQSLGFFLMARGGKSGVGEVSPAGVPVPSFRER